MCGIVGGVSFDDIGPTLLHGLKRLEYRGYDSAGLAIISNNHHLYCERVLGKVNDLNNKFKKQPIAGRCGLAHTRWATHGIPSENNAHPLISHEQVAVVHNGIIENHKELRDKLIKKGYEFFSETDSEVITHLIHFHFRETSNLLEAVKMAVNSLEGMFAIGVISTMDEDKVIAARSGSPLIIGLGENENYIASDSLALLPKINKFIYLEEGDIAQISKNEIKIYNQSGKEINREVSTSTLSESVVTRNGYAHFMQKEIFEQPNAAAAMLEGRVSQKKIYPEIFGHNASLYFKDVDKVVLVACGTSFYAALVAGYWLEEIAGISSEVEIASEYRYREPVIKPNTLFVALSQSGETADTLAAFRLAKKQPYLTTLAICNVPQSSLVREAELVLLTRAGPEIGVASTKSFTTQLIALFMLTIVLGRQNKLNEQEERHLVKKLCELPIKLKEVLAIYDQVKNLAQHFIHKEHALFLGRGTILPIAMEGALKLKEITYIHAEAYPAGELKHGPLAIIDKNMPVIVVAPNNGLFKKLKSNLEEVKARGGDLIVFADKDLVFDDELGIRKINMPSIDCHLAPITYVIPLQLLAYAVGILKGTDVDQPRNLAKSVTVE